MVKAEVGATIVFYLESSVVDGKIPHVYSKIASDCNSKNTILGTPSRQDQIKTGRPRAICGQR